MSSSEEDYVPISRRHLDAVLDLIAGGHDHDQRLQAAAHQAGYRQGEAVKTGNGYETGYNLGHDTGLSARQDTRSFVQGVLDGWAQGCTERQQVARQLVGQIAPRQDEREQEAGELEAGA